MSISAYPSMLLLLLFATSACAAAHWPEMKDGEHADVDFSTFDCSMRWLAYEYGKQLIV
jgi:hypothetical protein